MGEAEAAGIEAKGLETEGALILPMSNVCTGSAIEPVFVTY